MRASDREQLLSAMRGKGRQGVVNRKEKEVGKEKVMRKKQTERHDMSENERSVVMEENKKKEDSCSDKAKIEGETGKKSAY